MRELSLNILDVAENSLKAGADTIKIDVEFLREENKLTVRVSDNGCGMTGEQIKHVTDPFYTTRTTRKVGLGVPLFKMAAEMSGGSFEISSVVNEGTSLTAIFKTDNVDFVPLGDIASTVELLCVSNPDVNIAFTESDENDTFSFESQKIRDILGDVPMDAPEVRKYGKIQRRKQKMKSIEELMAIRDKTRKNMTVREDTGDSKIRVVVGMATCGIAAGARPVLNAFVDEIAKRDVKGVSVQQTGCIGMCQYEPIVEVTEPGKEKVTYVKMTPEKAVRVVNDHIVNGNPVAEFTVGAIKD